MNCHVLYDRCIFLDAIASLDLILNAHWIYIECTLNTNWNIAKHGAIMES